ncbi:MAG: Ig-like domain-containing protein, partial [Oscillospiraceae bacterium]|nr:Ig-like domain-containing protein [Oscillospiraceae bacterium]
ADWSNVFAAYEALVGGEPLLDGIRVTPSDTYLDAYSSNAVSSVDNRTAFMPNTVALGAFGGTTERHVPTLVIPSGKTIDLNGKNLRIYSSVATLGEGELIANGGTITTYVRSLAGETADGPMANAIAITAANPTVCNRIYNVAGTKFDMTADYSIPSGVTFGSNSGKVGGTIVYDVANEADLSATRINTGNAKPTDLKLTADIVLTADVDVGAKNVNYDNHTVTGGKIITTGTETNKPTAPATPELDITAKTLTAKDETFTLTLSNATATGWTSDNTAVATVENGVVTAVANGTATITVTYEGGSLTCEVTVDIAAPSDPELNASTKTLSGVGSTFQLVVNNAPSGKTLTWKTNNAAAATVSSEGLVTAVSNGTAIVTVAWDEGSLTCVVTVENAATSTHYDINVGDQKNFWSRLMQAHDTPGTEFKFIIAKVSGANVKPDMTVGYTESEIKAFSSVNVSGSTPGYTWTDAAAEALIANYMDEIDGKYYFNFKFPSNVNALALNAVQQWHVRYTAESENAKSWAAGPVGRMFFYPVNADAFTRLMTYVQTITAMGSGNSGTSYGYKNVMLSTSAGDTATDLTLPAITNIVFNANDLTLKAKDITFVHFDTNANGKSAIKLGTGITSAELWIAGTCSDLTAIDDGITVLKVVATADELTAALANDGFDGVVLGADITTDAAVAIAAGKTIDFNGCVLTCTSYASEGTERNKESGSVVENGTTPAPTPELSETAKTLTAKDETFTLTLSNATATGWTSDNTAVATVADGVVTAVANGTATITVTYEGGSLTCEVTVDIPAVTPTATEVATKAELDAAFTNGDEAIKLTADINYNAVLTIPTGVTIDLDGNDLYVTGLVNNGTLEKNSGKLWANVSTVATVTAAVSAADVSNIWAADEVLLAADSAFDGMKLTADVDTTGQSPTTAYNDGSREAYLPNMLAADAFSTSTKYGVVKIPAGKTLDLNGKTLLLRAARGTLGDGAVEKNDGRLVLWFNATSGQAATLANAVSIANELPGVVSKITQTSGNNINYTSYPIPSGVELTKSSGSISSTSTVTFECANEADFTRTGYNLHSKTTFKLMNDITLSKDLDVGAANVDYNGHTVTGGEIKTSGTESNKPD